MFWMTSICVPSPTALHNLLQGQEQWLLGASFSHSFSPSPSICKQDFSSLWELTEPRHSALKTLALLAMGERAPSQVTVKRHSLDLDNPRKVTSKGHHTQ